VSALIKSDKLHVFIEKPSNFQSFPKRRMGRKKIIRDEVEASPYPISIKRQSQKGMCLSVYPK
jgi:hypothetical protein